MSFWHYSVVHNNDCTIGVFFADVILTDKPENMSVTVGDHVTITCTATSFLFQPQLHWIMDSEIYTD